MAKYPIFLELAGQKVVLIGAGAVAARKAQSLLDAGARLVIVAEYIDPVLEIACHSASAELIRGKYSREYLLGALLVIAATDNHKLNRQIYRDCQELEILCNIVDEPEHCDFFTPAVVKRGNLQVAIGTSGGYPAYAGHIREKLEKIFTEKHGEFLTELQNLRKQILAKVPSPADRKVLLGQLVDDESFDYFVKNGPEQWRSYAETLISQCKSTAAPG